MNFSFAIFVILFITEGKCLLVKMFPEDFNLTGPAHMGTFTPFYKCDTNSDCKDLVEIRGPYFIERPGYLTNSLIAIQNPENKLPEFIRFDKMYILDTAKACECITKGIYIFKSEARGKNMKLFINVCSSTGGGFCYYNACELRR